MMKLKKMGYTVICALLVASTMAGCTSTAKSTTADTTKAVGTTAQEQTTTAATTAAATTTASKEPVTLTILANQDWVTKPYMKAIWQLYEDKTGNKLDIQAVPIDSGETIMKTKFATGEISDIFMHFGGSGLAAYQPEKNFVDFSGAAWVADVQDYVLPQTKFNDKVYGLPFWEASISGVIYNTEIFDNLGLKMPTTQAEFMTACETIKNAGITPMYLACKDTWPLLYQYGVDNMFLDSAVLGKLNSNTLKYADIPAFKTMIQWYKDMADKGYFGDKFATNTYDGAPAALGEGKAAMMLSWDSYASSDLDTKYPGISSKFSIMPAFVGAVDGGSYEGPNVCLTFVNKNSKNVEAAKEYVAFMADPANYNQAFKDFGTTPVFKGETTNKTTSLYDSAAAVIAEKTVASTAWPSVIGFTQVEGAKYIQECMLGISSVDECIAAMDNDRIQIAKAQQTPGF